MLDSRITGELLVEARRTGAKLILAGDDRQLANIERGGLFTELTARHGAAEITEVTRQKVDWQRQAAHDLAEGRFAEAVATYDRAGSITWTQDQAAVRAAWSRPGSGTRRQRLEPHALCSPTPTGTSMRSTPNCTSTLGKLWAVLDSGRAVSWSAAEFPGFRHGYAGTIYKGRGKTLDHTYLYHTEHWRSAPSYVGLTRQRESAQVFVARETARRGPTGAADGTRRGQGRVCRLGHARRAGSGTGTAARRRGDAAQDEAAREALRGELRAMDRQALRQAAYADRVGSAWNERMMTVQDAARLADPAYAAADRSAFLREGGRSGREADRAL